MVSRRLLILTIFSSVMIKESHLYDFLSDIDQDFSPCLSSKVNLKEYVTKILDNAELIVDVDYNLRGLVVLYCNDIANRKAYISLCGVRKEFRGKGIARQLMINAIEVAKEKGMRALGIHSNNIIAINLYKSLGFTTKEPGIREYLELEL